VEGCVADARLVVSGLIFRDRGDGLGGGLPLGLRRFLGSGFFFSVDAVTWSVVLELAAAVAEGELSCLTLACSVAASAAFSFRFADDDDLRFGAACLGGDGRWKEYPMAIASAEIFIGSPSARVTRIGRSEEQCNIP
jgi:hypothetical protein